MTTKNIRRVLLGAIGVAAIFLAGAAQAAAVPGQGTWETTLKGRDIDGHAVASSSASAVFLYDTSLDITWLRDANLNGAQDWSTANTWANSLTVGAYTGWRLPTLEYVDDTDCHFSYSGGTCGFNPSTAANEMAHLFYVTLGNKAPYDASGNPQTGAGLTNTGNFENLVGTVYWSGLVAREDSSKALCFDFYDGLACISRLENSWPAFAVRSGDVLAPVPEPGTYALMLAGLAALTLGRRPMRE